jgi:hypothetical protein
VKTFTIVVTTDDEHADEVRNVLLNAVHGIEEDLYPTDVAYELRWEPS